MSTGTVFLYCYVGTFTTAQFLNYGDASYKSLWYRYPLDLQKAVQLIIADAQRPLIFHGFGIIDLNLMVFTKVRVLVTLYDQVERMNHKLDRSVSGDENRVQLLFDVQTIN